MTGEHYRGKPIEPGYSIPYFFQKYVNNYVPLTFAASILPEQVGTLERTDRLDACFIGTTYKPEWVRGLKNVVYTTGNVLPEQERINLFLSSKIALGFHADVNIRNNLITERVFEGLAYGCVVISDNPCCKELTGGIVQTVTSYDEFVKVYNELINDTEKMKDLQRRGYEWARENGLYVHTVQNFLNKINQLF